MRVLIVDDSMVIRRVVESALLKADLGVEEAVTAADGAEGLEVLEQAEAAGRPIDLVLSDVHMPGMDGLEFLQERQRRGVAQGVPVLMVTADLGDPQVVAALDAGAQGYLAKPFTVGEIRERVSRVWEGSFERELVG